MTDREMLLQDQAVAAVDIETSGFNPWRGDRVLGLSLATSRGSTYIPFGHLEEHENIKAKERRDLLVSISQIDRLVFHNALFDLSFLVPLGLRPTELWDTMVFAWLDDENQRLGLKELTDDKDLQTELKHAMKAHCVECGGTKSRAPKKSEAPPPGGRFCVVCEQRGAAGMLWQPKRGWGELTVDEIAPYATRDAELTLQLYQEQQLNTRVSPAAMQREMRILRIALDMTLRGLPVDISRARRELERCLSKSAELAEGFPVSISSPKQVGEYLTERGLDLGLTAAGKVSTDRDALLPHQQDKQVARILAWRDVTKESQFYAKLLELVGTDGSVHPRWRPTGTVSGRFSCNDPNLQQFPRAGAVRSCVDAPSGMVLVTGDLSQAELRVAAHYASCQRLIEWFTSGEDVYQNVADELAVPLQTAKIVVLSSLYGVGPRKMRTILLRGGVVATFSEAKSWLNGWRALVPELSQGLDRAERVAQSRGYVRLIQEGRVRHFAGAARWKAKPRDAWNAIIQGGVAECIKNWMIATHETALPGVRLCAQVHDSLSWFVPEDVVDQWQKIAEEEWHLLNPFDVTIPIKWKRGL